jgi:lipopolysaccharide transport system ATP-binding protein
MASDGNDIAIRVDGISKCYRIYEHPRDRLLEVISGRLHDLARPFYGASAHKTYHREFWALRDVSFSIGRGETVGIMGRNGAGKSTLLQILAGTMSPTTGNVETHGRIAALLELGSGFNPEFTGCENVYFNASVMGLSKTQIDQTFDEIVAFADIGEFIQQPVKTYSTGMMMRLAFAVQTAIDPSVLIVDEALSVGDARFQKKCFDKFRAFRAAGKTILLVTHSSDAITAICDRAILLDGGKVVADDEPLYVTKFYHRLLFGTPAEQSSHAGLDCEHTDEGVSQKVEGGTSSMMTIPDNANVPQDPPTAPALAYQSSSLRYGDRKAEILGLVILDEKRAPAVTLESGKYYHFQIRVMVHENLSDIVAAFLVRDLRGIDLYGTDTLLQDVTIPPHQGGQTFAVEMSIKMSLAPGRYFLTPSVTRANGKQYDLQYDAVLFEVTGDGKAYSNSRVNLEAKIVYKEHGSVKGRL